MVTDLELNNLETEITDDHTDANNIVIKGPVIKDFNETDNIFKILIKGLFLLISISSVFLYVIYSILFLVVDRNESDRCDNIIWNYNLSLIKKFFEILFGILWLGLGIFGLIIVKQEDCEKMKSTKLLEFTNVISMIITILGSIMLLDGIGKIIYFYWLINAK